MLGKKMTKTFKKKEKRGNQIHDRKIHGNVTKPPMHMEQHFTCIDF